MQQLSLELQHPLVYSAESFYLHEGSKNLCTRLEVALHGKGYSTFFIVGEKRAGKSHLLVYLHEQSSKAGLFPKIIEGKDFLAWMQNSNSQAKDYNEEVILVDDVDHCFNDLPAGASGPFVALVEKLRHKNCTLIMTSTLQIEELPCDQHIVSRLREGNVEFLSAPAEEDLWPILQAIAKQRGLKLNDRKASFLQKRLPRNLADLETYFDKLCRLLLSSTGSIKIKTLQDAL